MSNYLKISNKLIKHPKCLCVFSKILLYSRTYFSQKFFEPPQKTFKRDLQSSLRMFFDHSIALKIT